METKNMDLKELYENQALAAAEIINDNMHHANGLTRGEIFKKAFKDETLGAAVRAGIAMAFAASEVKINEDEAKEFMDAFVVSVYSYMKGMEGRQ